jgi:hypothetical protein
MKDRTTVEKHHQLQPWGAVHTYINPYLPDLPHQNIQPNNNKLLREETRQV